MADVHAPASPFTRTSAPTPVQAPVLHVSGPKGENPGAAGLAILLVLLAFLIAVMAVRGTYYAVWLVVVPSRGNEQPGSNPPGESGGGGSQPGSNPPPEGAPPPPSGGGGGGKPKE